MTGCTPSSVARALWNSILSSKDLSARNLMMVFLVAFGFIQGCSSYIADIRTARTAAEISRRNKDAMDDAIRIRNQKSLDYEIYTEGQAREQEVAFLQEFNKRSREMRTRQEAPSNLSGSVDREAAISQVDQEIQDNLQKYRELQPSANTDSSARMECTYLLMKLRELADSSDDRQLKIRIAYAINRKKTYGDFVPL